MNTLMRKHCWHAIKGILDDTCCWCGISRHAYELVPGHGPFAPKQEIDYDTRPCQGNTSVQAQIIKTVIDEQRGLDRPAAMP